MKEQLLALYALQTLDVKITQANARLAALDGAKELKKKHAAAKLVRDAAEKALSEQETELMDLELKLKSVDEKRVNYEKRLYSGAISNPKELGAVEKEIQMLKDQQGKLDGRALGLYDTVESARNSAQAARKTTEDAEKQVREALASEASEKKKLDAELVELTSEREKDAAKVTERALMSRYETVRKRTGGTGIARVVSGKCEGCRINIMPFTVRKLGENKELVNCESCGRILVLDASNNE
jgi:uncharacterized protein